MGRDGSAGLALPPGAPAAVRAQPGAAPERLRDADGDADGDGDGDWEYVYSTDHGLTSYQSTTTIPGFEVIIIITALALVLFLKRKRKDKD